MKLTPEDSKRLMDEFVIENKPVFQQAGELSIKDFAKLWGVTDKQAYTQLIKHEESGKLEKAKVTLYNGKLGNIYRVVK